MAIAAVQYFAHAQPTKVLFVDWNTSRSRSITVLPIHIQEDDVTVEPKIEKILTTIVKGHSLTSSAKPEQY